MEVSTAKELSLCNKGRFSNPYIICVTQCRRHLIFQAMTSVRSRNPNLKYQRFTPPGCKYRLFCKNSIPYDPLGPLGLFKEEYALFTTLPFKPLSSQ